MFTHKNTIHILIGLVLVFAVVLRGAPPGVVTEGLVADTPSVRQDGPARIVIEYDFADFTRQSLSIDGRTYTKIVLTGEGAKMKKGAPDLPHVCRSVIIPDDARMAVSVVDSSYYEIEDIDIVPSKGPILRNVSPAEVLYTFGEDYQADAFYPEPLATLGDPYILRNHRGIVVTVNPFRYNPVQRILRVYTEITVEVAAAGPGTVNVLKRRARPRAAGPSFATIYKSHFLNYRGPRRPHPKKPDRGGGSVLESYSPLDEDGEMLIIVHDDWEDDVEQFADWKTSLGIPTTIAPVDDIDANTPPSADKIKEYIQDFYDSNDHDLAFVLLVGDSGQVPPIVASGGASDPSYSKLAGSDNYPDIMVGRFSATSSSHVDTQVERTIDYELMKPRGDAWFWRGTGIAVDEYTGDDGEKDWEHLRKIRGQLLDPNYDYTSVDELYQGSQGGADAAGTPTASTIATCINAGRGLINYSGHGRKDYWVYRNPPKTGTWYDFFSNGNVNGLLNDNELPFIFSVACSVGDFDGGSACFAETWLRATHSTSGDPTGAVGFYGASRTQYWSPPMEAQDEFNSLIVNEGYTSFGALCFAGSCSMMDKYGSSGVTMFNTWIVFGDPSLNIMEAQRKYIYVDCNATGNNDGTSWENAYTDLEDALDAADDGTQIWVAEGTYTPGTSRSDEFDIEYVSVQLYGGFDPNSGDDEWSERDWGENATILSGEIGEPTDADNCYHVIQMEECDANTVIDGFTITDGYGSVYTDGGGIDVRESLATIRNCVFDDNHAGDDGGAINILDDSVLTIVNCVFIDNDADDDGGAIAIQSSCRVTLINCTFCDNDADDMGGSIYNNGDNDVNSIITNCIFDSSYSPYSDDDIYNTCDADPIISYCCTDDCGESGVDWDPDCGFDGGGNIDVGPDFVDDGDGEGDDDKWMTCDDGLRLESDSDCRDVADNNSVPADLDTDIKGSDRIINGTVDMGAYEYDSGC
ncbi:MAG: C25 family cysteine peptidase [Planctomycetota bacterium]|jgi:hypothetical protein